MFTVALDWINFCIEIVLSHKNAVETAYPMIISVRHKGIVKQAQFPDMFTYSYRVSELVFGLRCRRHS